MIYCIGSSQVNIFTGVDKIPLEWPLKVHEILPWFKTFHIGPVTAYQAKKHFVKVRNILEANKYNRSKDYFLPVFGSVDMRMHVYKQVVKQKKPVEAIVNNIANRYLANIRLLLFEGYRIILYGCVGTSVRSRDAGSHPKFGTVKERNAATELFNDRLIDFCIRHDLHYLSIFDEMLLDNGKTDLRYMDTDFMGNGNGLHATTKMLPLLLWKCRDIGLISFNTAFLPFEAGNYFRKEK